jgi:alpha-ketoglutarate-dependent taurine dioxygenase
VPLRDDESAVNVKNQHKAMAISSLGRLGARVTAAVPLGVPAGVILDALHRYRVVHIPVGKITQSDMVEWFASLGVQPLPQRGREHARGAEPQVFVVSDLGEPSPFLSSAHLELHSDLSYRREPGTFSALYAATVPARGGDTVFVDAVSAFASLEPSVQERLRGLRARHRHPEPHMNPADEREGAEEGVLHPAVRRHPATGEEALFVSPYFTSRLEGDAEPVDEAAALLELANSALRLPVHQYVHRWSEGDLVAWDNRSTVHGRQAFEGERVLWRTQARGAV